MSDPKLDEKTIYSNLRKAPLSAPELARKLKCKGASSIARVRTILSALVDKGMATTGLRRGARGRPATVYSRV